MMKKLLLLLVVLLKISLGNSSAASQVHLSKQSLISLIKQGHKDIVNKYLYLANSTVYIYDTQKFKSDLVTIEMNKTNGVLRIEYNQSFTYYTKLVSGGGWRQDKVKGATLSLLFTNHTIQLHSLTFQQLGTSTYPIHQYSLDSLQELKDNMYTVVNTFATHHYLHYSSLYDLGYYFKADHLASMDNNGLAIPITATCMQQYSAVHMQDIDKVKASTTEHTFNATSGDNLQINRQLFQEYLDTGYTHHAFQVTMSSAAIQLWQKWLGLSINNIDVGFVKSFVPEVQTDLADEQLLDVSVQALDTPSVQLQNGEVKLTIQANVQFSYKQLVIAQLTLDTLVHSTFKYNPQSTALDLVDLQFDFTQIQFVDDQQQLVHQGAGFALNAFAQAFTPAIIKMVNLKGLNVKHFVEFKDTIKTEIKDINFERNNMIIEMTQPDFSNFSFKKLYDQIKKQ